LGEFSPIGRLFTLGSFLKITKVAQFFGQHLSIYKSVVLFVLKKGWSKLCAIFSQTYLVTLLVAKS
jgi:hypothetical protein